MPGERLVWRLFPRMLGVLVAWLAALALSLRWVDGTAWRVAVVATETVGFAAVVSWLLARGMGRCLRQVTDTAERFAAGGWRHKLRLPDCREMIEVAEALNALGRGIESRIASLERRNHEQEAVLTSMAEGVLAVDMDQRVISVNAAAAKLLGAQPAEIEGRGLQEVVRNADLQRFVTNALLCRQPIEGNLVLRHARDRLVQANGTALRDPAGQGLGAVIVLNDVSRLRQLENIRRDFAANVSHELRTPIASIKGFVETLLDGAMAEPADAERFLRIIARQADRLNSIVEDLLTLSRIEKEAENADIPRSETRLSELFEAAVRECSPRAAERGIEIVVDCTDDLKAIMNAALVEQAVLNLLDNAIKYSGEDGKVELRGAFARRGEGAGQAERADGRGEVVISVRDYGCGIAEEHHARLFERFYRVDKARSRKLGGTGLGLAIVKHIARAHGGQVSVRSAPGEGSTFEIRLPAEAA
jgi:two-component system, OmpR family, phosphate regulon sensor histidine kinase PhoR